MEYQKIINFLDSAPINNTEINNVNHINIVMRMYNLIEYNNYSKASGRLWQYYQDGSSNNLIESESFNVKIKIRGNTPTDGNTKDVKIVVPFKYLSNFCRTPEMSLINCQVRLILTCSSTFVISNVTGAGILTITDTKLYVPVVTL